MKRPYLVNFAAVEADGQISVKASVTDSYTPLIEKRKRRKSAPTSPIQSIGLIASDEYRVKLAGFNERRRKIYSREFESDRFGLFDFKIPASVAGEKIVSLEVYEVSYRPGLELLMGGFLPYKIDTPKQIVISDFDKTLVDTKYSTALEVYYSLRKPLSHFPTIKESLDLLKGLVGRGFQPFILSASPHFYENAIRDWLYQNKIYAGNIFLKDYRNIFSFREGVLTAKDLGKQSFYKLDQMVNILLMTGIPRNLALMGDCFESDELIYLILAAALKGRQDPWKIWNLVKREESFNLTTKQDFHFLSKFYQLGEMARKNPLEELRIHIRCSRENYEKVKNRPAAFDFLQDHKSAVSYYLA